MIIQQATQFDEPLTAIADLTPASLTDRLRNSGSLFSGEVTKILQFSNRATLFARIWHLSVEYTTDAPRSAPRKLFVKMSRPDMKANGREVEFYHRVAPAMLRPSAPRCYDAAYSEEEHAYHLILEDLSDTHHGLEFGLPPTRQEAEQIVDTLAEFHVCWWNHPRLDHEIGEIPTEEELSSYVGKLADAFPRLVDFLGDRMTLQQRDLYEWVFSNYPRVMTDRLERGHHLTLTHGDAHAWNFLFPRDSQCGRTCMVDWYTHRNTWRGSMGVADLACLIVPWWSSERRRELETELLRRYHQQLQQWGVSNYDWDDLGTDYRLASLRFLFDPLMELGRASPSRWFPWFERTTATLIDLKSTEL